MTSDRSPTTWPNNFSAYIRQLYRWNQASLACFPRQPTQGSHQGTYLTSYLTKTANLTLACSLTPREFNPDFLLIYPYMCNYIVFIFIQHLNHTFSIMDSDHLVIQSWAIHSKVITFSTSCLYYGAGDVLDEYPYIHMSSIQNDIDINNIIFYHSHELWWAVRRQG